MRRLLLPLAALAALAAAGRRGAGGSTEALSSTEVAVAKSYRFEPKVIEVEAGDTVTWRNDDNFTHTVQVDGREDHEVEQGESFEIAFDEPGTYHYVCTLHRQDMDGTVIVR